MSDSVDKNTLINSIINGMANVAQPNRTNVLNRPEWKAPKRVEPRPGAYDYKSWPSKGGD